MPAVMAPVLNLVAYVLAGLGGGLLALRTGIPAAALAGALLGAGLVSMSGRLEPAQWPGGTRTLLEIAIGTVIGTSLTAAALSDLRQLWRPAVVITVSSGMSLVGTEFGVGAAVASLHAVRLITVLLVLPIIVRLVLGQQAAPPG